MGGGGVVGGGLAEVIILHLYYACKRVCVCVCVCASSPESSPWFLAGQAIGNFEVRPSVSQFHPATSQDLD